MKSLTTSVFLLGLAGCAASPTPNYDRHFGEAVRQARIAMTINPEAGRAPDQNVGLDGRAAALAITRYQNSFREPPPPVNVINIGTGGAPGGGR